MTFVFLITLEKHYASLPADPTAAVPGFFYDSRFARAITWPEQGFRIQGFMHRSYSVDTVVLRSTTMYE